MVRLQLVWPAVPRWHQEGNQCYSNCKLPQSQELLGDLRFLAILASTLSNIQEEMSWDLMLKQKQSYSKAYVCFCGFGEGGNRNGVWDKGPVLAPMVPRQIGMVSSNPCSPHPIVLILVLLLRCVWRRRVWARKRQGRLGYGEWRLDGRHTTRAHTQAHTQTRSVSVSDTSTGSTEQWVAWLTAVL